jgi:chromate transporter
MSLRPLGAGLAPPRPHGGPRGAYSPPMASTQARTEPSLAEIVRQWGRIGCIGFGGPPAHVALFRELCVARRRWLSDVEFERAIAATNLLPGPASTQLAIYCAWRLRGTRGALLGGLCFILPGLVMILALSVLFLGGSPPAWLRGAGAGAGAAVAAVAVHAGLGVARPVWARAERSRRPRVLLYALAGGIAAALAGPFLVLVLLACGAAELARHELGGERARIGAWLMPAWAFLARGGACGRLADASARRWPGPLALLGASAAPGGTAALVWTALKVGALAFGGGFVIVPLMQADAVGAYHWMTHAQFLNAVALGQVTPGPLVQTIAAVGYSAAGIPGGLLAAAVAFAPSFSFILIGAARFERLLVDARALAFLGGAAPAAAGAIIGSAVPLTGALSETWQYGLLACAAVALLALRRGVVSTLLLAGAAGLAIALLGGPVPG